MAADRAEAKYAQLELNWEVETVRGPGVLFRRTDGGFEDRGEMKAPVKIVLHEELHSKRPLPVVVVTLMLVGTLLWSDD